MMTLVLVLLMHRRHISCKRKFNPKPIKEEFKVPFRHVEKTIKERIKKFFKHIKAPTSLTSISGKVCPRRPSLLISNQVNQLKKALRAPTRNKGLRTCTRVIVWQFKKKPTSPRRPMGVKKPDGKFLRKHRCSVSSMTDEEKQARNDLKPHGIRKERICVRKESCQERGNVDPNTQTINMCRSCRFTVYIPEK